VLHLHQLRIDLQLKRPKNLNAPITTFDIDSVVSFIDLLEALKNGLRYIPTPNIIRNIKTDLYLQLSYEYRDEIKRIRSKSADLRDVPYYLLGFARRRNNIFVYILFPYAYKPL